MLRIIKQFSRKCSTESLIYYAAKDGMKRGMSRGEPEIAKMFGLTMDEVDYYKRGRGGENPYLNLEVTETSLPKNEYSDEKDSGNFSLNPKEESKNSLTKEEGGSVKMVSTANKEDSIRIARASASVALSKTVFQKVKDSEIKKGDVLTVAQVAGIIGAKQTSSILPLCHNITLSHVDVKLELMEESSEILIKTEVGCVGTTGVEMEAMTAAAIASLTVYDMCKSVDKGIEIKNLRLEHKSGGKSGDYSRKTKQ